MSEVYNEEGPIGDWFIKKVNQFKEFSGLMADMITSAQNGDEDVIEDMVMRNTPLVEKLYKDGIDAEVVHVPVVKPLDGATILDSVQKTGAVITAEEHQITGGLGGAIAEFLMEHYLLL